MPDATDKFPAIVLDDLPWSQARLDDATHGQALREILMLVRTAVERGQTFMRPTTVYEIACDPQTPLYSALFERTLLSRDERVELATYIDHASLLDDAALEDFSVVLENVDCIAPSVCWTAQRLKLRQAVACVTPQLSSRRTWCDVNIGERTERVFFVADPYTHLDFFRRCIVDWRSDEETFCRLCRSAFPCLLWADGALKGLRDFSKPYREICEELVRHFAVLNDRGAQYFALKKHIQVVLAFQADNIVLSTENHETMDNPKCRRARERSFDGVAILCSWHLKLESHQDRIYIHYPLDERVVVGVLHRHLPLPGD